jgi:hypothetical protein
MPCQHLLLLQQRKHAHGQVMLLLLLADTAVVCWCPASTVTAVGAAAAFIVSLPQSLYCQQIQLSWLLLLLLLLLLPLPQLVLQAHGHLVVADKTLLTQLAAHTTSLRDSTCCQLLACPGPTDALQLPLLNIHAHSQTAHLLPPPCVIAHA